MSDQTTLTQDNPVRVYIHAAGKPTKGLCAWSASIVDGVHVRELGGISATDPFSRLTIVAAIEALVVRVAVTLGG